MTDRSNAWHQSTLELIHNCSWRWFLTYVCGLADEAGEAAQDGTYAHSVVEFIETERMNGRKIENLDEVLDKIDNPNVYAAVRNWVSSKMKDKGLSHYDWLQQWTPVALEQYFNLPLVDGAWNIGGTMDGLYMDSDGVYHIVDYKTTKDMSRWKSDGEGKRHQATLYSVAVQLKYNLDYLPDVTYTVARTNHKGETAKRVVVYPDLADVRILGEKIREAQRIVDTQDFVKNPAWMFCDERWCPHYQGCMVTGELSGTPVTVQNRLTGKVHLVGGTV